MSKRFDPSKTVQNIAEDIGDRSPVNWDEALEQAPRAAGTIEGLRLIERVAMAHRSAGSEESGEAASSGAEASASSGATGAASVGSNTPLFTWGSLQILEQIGEGGFAEVYRAWAPSLQRQVALKLRRADAASSASSRWIEEARRLAGVRHPNVLVVHGAAVHDEREGIWTDLIEGDTLADWAREQGSLGPREAAIVGIDLCLALAAVHASGLVHGDVKASNVMRESGGHLILMDFGSGHRLGESAGHAHSGTPLVSAPELLEGDPATPASDVYALGVLLYWLVSGEYPVEADSLEQLRQRLRDGESVALRERRPDLPSAFVQIVERALATDADARWSGPSELESALAELLSGKHREATAGSSMPPSSKLTRRWMPAVMVGLALSVAAIWWVTRGGESDQLNSSPFERVIVAGSELSVELGMVRVDNGELHPLAPGTPLTPGMRLALQLNCSVAAHVYVLNEDEKGELFVLFPVQGVDLANPLDSKSTHILPGRQRGRQQSWVVTSAGGMERFLAIVSRQPLSAIEEAIADFRRASSGRAVEYPSLSDGLLESLRGVGGMADAETETSTAGDTLERIAASLVASSADPDGLWVWGASFPNPVAAPAER